MGKLVIEIDIRIKIKMYYLMWGSEIGENAFKLKVWKVKFLRGKIWIAFLLVWVS